MQRGKRILCALVLITATGMEAHAYTYARMKAPAEQGVDVNGWAKDACGWYSFGQVAFVSSATCPANSIRYWDLPLTKGLWCPSCGGWFTDLAVNGYINTAFPNNITCRGWSYNETGTSYWSTSQQATTQQGPFEFYWDNALYIVQNGYGFISCQASIPSASSGANWLYGYRWNGWFDDL